MDCPGCGFQRSFFAMLSGDIKLSLQLYPAMLPIVFIMVFTAVHIRYKLSFGAAVIKFAYIFTAIIILTSYIIKIINHKIFC